MKTAPAMLALVTDAFGGRGGIAQYNRDFLEALAGMSAITVLPRHAPDPVAAPESIRQLQARSGRFAYSVAALRVAGLQEVEVVFCGHLYMAPLAALVAWWKNARLIVQMHGIEAWRRPTRMQRAASERADLVLCVSRHTRAAVLAWAAIAPERVLVVSNTVRDAFTPGPVQHPAWAGGGKKILLTVARMDSRERYKGHDRVIAAIPDLVARGYDICYAIVGDGDDRPRLEALARDAGVGERVRFLGALDLPTLIESYRAADLFVMPSTGEGFGVSFLEAMASGTPALGLDVAGARDALADGELGTVVAERELADTIARLLSQPKPDGQSLANRARARFGRKPFAENVHNTWNRLMGKESIQTVAALAGRTNAPAITRETA
jgi:phosphatidylinositol alpha-1,6-mannosyltransferase